MFSQYHNLISIKSFEIQKLHSMDTSNDSILVTGGTGRIGSIIISKLLEKGHTVTSLTRSDPAKCKDYGTNHKWVQYDLYKSNSEQNRNLADLI